MDKKTQVLQEENKTLKKKIMMLEKKLEKIKRPSRKSTKANNKDNCQLEFYDKNNNFNESSIEISTSKESIQKVADTEIELLNQLNSPPKKKKLGKNDEVRNKKTVSVKPKQIISDLKNLKRENKHLKSLIEKDKSKCLSRASRGSVDRNQSPNKLRKKSCKICSKLLSKGYTTKFCPTHGY